MKPGTLRMSLPAHLKAADLEKTALHEARAALAGKEECRCRLCKRVDAALATEGRPS